MKVFTPLHIKGLMKLEAVSMFCRTNKSRRIERNLDSKTRESVKNPDFFVHLKQN